MVQESVTPTPTPADTNGIRTETIISPSPLVGGDIKISNGFDVTERTHEYVVEMAIFNVHSAITPKVCNSELRFLCCARRLMVLNICAKFHENILNGFEVTERTRICGKNAIFQCSKGNNSKKMQSRVTVPALCTLSHPP